MKAVIPSLASSGLIVPPHSLHALAEAHVPKRHAEESQNQRHKNQVQHFRSSFAFIALRHLQTLALARPIRTSKSLVGLLTVKREYKPENQNVLGWSQADHTGLYFSTSEEASMWSTRIVPPVLQPQDRIGPSIREAIFERSRDGFDRLSG